MSCERTDIAMKDAYFAQKLPVSSGKIDQSYFFEELIDATARLEVYKEKIKDSKLDSFWFMPTLQQKEALASSQMEGTQATLDGVFINQVLPNDKDKNLNEVRNYYSATDIGYKYLSKRDFSDEFFFDIHKSLMSGNVRKPKTIGHYRTEQNYIGRNDSSHAITFVPPVPEEVPFLMDNLIDYINEPKDNYRPLVRTAIIHAQFETIHPFMDGNGRVGRMLIPMYLFSQKQIELPCFFISEALEQDKFLYYSLLNGIRYSENWNEWIKFFLSAVTKQCEKYIDIISKINALYERHLDAARDLARSSNIVDVINALYRYPVTTAKQIADVTEIPISSVSRYLATLVDNRIIYTDNKSRNRTYFYFELLEIIR
ncbi:MAG TPA: Fic family protein [Ruminococcaceae bacterium]|nr:Fic family protein [Oscillospiraceae bacterium]